MTQLIINGITLPETSNDKYECYPADLSVQVDMISGRRVSEVRGTVQVIRYRYDYMGNELMRGLLIALRSGSPLTVQYLPDDSDRMAEGRFWVEQMAQPAYAFSRSGVPYWHNVEFTLREVEPHD